MHRTELWTSQPTYGTPESCSRPWTAPSSPCSPCRSGRTTSSPRASHPPVPLTRSPRTLLSGASTAWRPPSMPASGPSHSRHSPSLEMPTQTSSYLEAFRHRPTWRADLTETSCSSEAPPKRTPTRGLPLTAGLRHEPRAVAQAALDHLPQRATRVEGRVGRDDHVGEGQEPGQVGVIDGAAAAVGVEDRLLALEHVEGRAAQPPRLERRQQGPGVDQATAAGVHDDGGGLHQ